MRIFNLLVISAALLLGLTAQTPRPHTVWLIGRYPVIADHDQNVPLSQLDERFDKMVAEAPCTIPYYFVNGTIAQAGQVNANNNAILSCLSTIYASDIVPTSQAQATFGGSLQYNFPAGVATQGGPNFPFTDVSGTLWVVQSGNNNGSYGVNFDENGCGGTGSYQFRVSGVQQSYIDCQGGYINQYGSIVKNAVTAANGNFIGGTGPVSLCSVSATNPCFTVTTAGISTSNGPLYAEPLASPTPGPVGACYIPNGNACPQTWHEVYADNVALIDIASCAANTLCTFTGGTTAPLAGNAQFHQPNGVWDVVCQAFSVTPLIVMAAINVSNEITPESVYNAGSTTITNSGFDVSYACWGQ